jgi:hypothetical protein
MIVEKASGLKFADFLKQRIFAPLGMKTASVPDLRQILPHRVRGYTLYNGKPINIMRQVRTELASHFGIFATINDLILWERGLRSSALLPKQKWREMWTEGRLSGGAGTGYGFGWNVWRRNSTTVLNHTGITGTEISRFPAEDVTVIILTNLGTWGTKETASADPYGLTQPIAGLFSPRIAFRPIKDNTPQLTKLARLTLNSLVVGEVPKSGVTEHFTEWSKSQEYFRYSYGFLGKLTKLVPVSAEDKEITYEAVFEKGSRYVGIEFDGELIDSIYPVDA